LSAELAGSNDEVAGSGDKEMQNKLRDPLHAAFGRLHFAICRYGCH
jgi:hypothetical protein